MPPEHRPAHKEGRRRRCQRLSAAHSRLAAGAGLARWLAGWQDDVRVANVWLNTFIRHDDQSESAKFTAFYAFPLVETVELLVLAHPRWPPDATSRFGAPPDTIRSALLTGPSLEHLRTCVVSLPAGVPRSIELDGGACRRATAASACRQCGRPACGRPPPPQLPRAALRWPRNHRRQRKRAAERRGASARGGADVVTIVRRGGGGLGALRRPAGILGFVLLLPCHGHHKLADGTDDTRLYHLRNVVIRTGMLNWLRFLYDF
jgi:hypothetical protein